MKRKCFQTKIADALTTLLSWYSNWTKPTTAATTHSNKMIVLSQLIVHGIQWAYDQAVRAVKIHSKDFNNFFSPKFEVCSSWIVWNWCNISVVFVCFVASDLSLDDRKRIMREGSSVDDITISSSTSVSRPRSVKLIYNPILSASINYARGSSTFIIIKGRDSCYSTYDKLLQLHQG